MYTLTGLRDAASFMKKQGVIDKKFAVTKASKETLMQLLKSLKYDMSTIRSIKPKSPKRVVGNVFRAVYPQKPIYDLKLLKAKAADLKKENKLKIVVGKMNLNDLISFIGKYKSPIDNKPIAMSSFVRTFEKPKRLTGYQKRGNLPIDAALPPIMKKKRGRPPKNATTTQVVPAEMIAGQRKTRKPRSDKGKKRK